eukprot:12875839-Ditylum_brightwellii.AAC.1
MPGRLVHGNLSGKELYCCTLVRQQKITSCKSIKLTGQKNSRNVSNYKEFLRKEFELEEFLRKLMN